MTTPSAVVELEPLPRRALLPDSLADGLGAGQLLAGVVLVSRRR